MPVRGRLKMFLRLSYRLRASAAVLPVRSVAESWRYGIHLTRRMRPAGEVPRSGVISAIPQCRRAKCLEASCFPGGCAAECSDELERRRANPGRGNHNGMVTKIGRLAGIDIFVHFTFLILLGWIGVSSFAATGD